MCINQEIPNAGSLIVYTSGDMDSISTKKLFQKINMAFFENGIDAYPYTPGMVNGGYGIICGIFLYNFVGMTEGRYHKIINDIMMLTPKKSHCLIMLAQEASIPERTLSKEETGKWLKEVLDSRGLI